MTKQEILDYLDNVLHPIVSPDNWNVYSELYDMIEELPSAEPHWIPCSERLPEENRTVIASTEYGVFPEARYTKEDGWEWAYESGADYWEKIAEVKAWMPLPEPYEGDKE